MDWNLKTPAWDSTEFDQQTISNIDVVNGSSSFGGQGTKGDFSVDLKLGRVSDSVYESGDKLKELGVSKMASSPSGSSKRARAANNATQRVSCLVDGCTSDLSNCRDYHKRHKVCEVHSKTSQVTIGGQQQRFCQQCSRFHSLEEFDEGKRSCRKRLDGHNRRRRKPQPEAILHSRSYLSNYQGNRLLPFCSSNSYPTTSVANPIWSGAVKTVEEAGIYNQQPQLNMLDKQNPFSESSSSSYRRGKQFTFLQGENPVFSNNTASETSVCQPLLKSIASSQSGGSSHRVVSNGQTTRVPDSGCALSLLSSQTMHTSGISLSHIVQPLGPGQHYSSFESMDSVLVPNASNANVHCQGLVQMSPDESSNDDDPQTLPFYWD